MNKLMLTAAFASLLAVAACDNAGDAPAPEATTETAPAPEATPPAEPAPAEPAPAATPPAAEVPAGVQDAMQQLQEQAAGLSDEQKQATIAEARTAAENAARAAGLTPEQVTQAGDAAENAARQAFGVQ